MPPELVRVGLRLGMLILLLALGALPFLRPASAEFWASVAAAGVAVLFIGGLVFVVSISRQSPPRKE
jgi:hypothetical protein